MANITLFKALGSTVVNGVGNLPAALTINGTTVTPIFRYKGGDATLTTLNDWTYGVNLAIGGTGAAPSLNQGSPLLGTNDDSVMFNGHQFYQSPDTTTGDIGAKDVVFEIIFKAINTDGLRLINKRRAAADEITGFDVWLNNTGTQSIGFLGSDGSGYVIYNSDNMLLSGCWYHCLLFINRDENSTSGAQWYVNGVATSAGSNFSARQGSWSSGEAMQVGALWSGNVMNGGGLAYVSMWTQASWHKAGAAGPTEWATVAKSRFCQLVGTYANSSLGSALPTTQARSTVAYLDKIEGSARKLYQVGANWPRLCTRKDSGATQLQAYLSENAATNYCLQSEDIGTTWAKFQANDTFSLNSAVAPNGLQTMDGLIASANNTQHYISQNPAIPLGLNTLSCWAKKGTQNWVALTFGTAYAYYNLNTGVVGTTVSGGTATIENWGGGLYRCILTATTAANPFTAIGAYSADGGLGWIGDGVSVAAYFWGMQVTATPYAVSYIPTTTTSAARSYDTLIYPGAGNLSALQVGDISLKALLDPWGNYDRYLASLPYNSIAIQCLYMSVIAASDQFRGTVFNNSGVANVVGPCAGTPDDGAIHTYELNWNSTTFTAYKDGGAGTSPFNATLVNVPNGICVGTAASDGSSGNCGGLISDVLITRPQTCLDYDRIADFRGGGR